MIRGALILLVLVGLLGCSTREVVVSPDQLSALNDSKWTIQSEPR
jgi:hypothetical protein